MMNRIGTMKTAFAYWENRIAPASIPPGRFMSLKRSQEKSWVRRGKRAGKFSDPDGMPAGGSGYRDFGLRRYIQATSRDGLQLRHGIVPFIAGDLHKVIHAWLRGSLEHAAFALPGCYGRGGWRFRGMYGSHQRQKS